LLCIPSANMGVVKRLLVSLTATVLAPSPALAGTNLTVDLGYGVYRGYQNGTTGLNVWKGYCHFGPNVIYDLENPSSYLVTLATRRLIRA